MPQIPPVCPLIGDADNYDRRGYLTEDFRLFHLKDTNTQEIAFHYHDFDKIIIFLTGEVNYLIEGRSYRLLPWDIVLVNHNEIHRPVVAAEVPYERIIIYLSPGFLSAYRSDTYDLSDCFRTAQKNHTHLLRMQPSARRSLMDSIERLEAAGSDTGYAHHLYQKVLFLEFLIQLNRIAGRHRLDYPDTQRSDSRILAVMDYIREHLSDPLSVDTLADRFHFSRYHLMRLFKQETGYTLSRYVTSKRLLAARELLSTDIPLTEICYCCGFQNYSSFFRAYKAEFGESPRTGRSR